MKLKNYSTELQSYNEEDIVGFMSSCKKSIILLDLLHCTNEPNVSIPTLANLLIERTQNPHWVVVFKGLITTHHLMCYGNEVRISPSFIFNLETYASITIHIVSNSVLRIHFNFMGILDPPKQNISGSMSCIIFQDVLTILTF